MLFLPSCLPLSAHSLLAWVYSGEYIGRIYNDVAPPPLFCSTRYPPTNHAVNRGKPRMKAVVFAYHDMGCQGVQALLDAGYEIAAIFTHTDNPGEKAFWICFPPPASARYSGLRPGRGLIIPCGLSALANWHLMLSSRSISAIY